MRNLIEFISLWPGMTLFIITAIAIIGWFLWEITHACDEDDFHE